MPDTNTYFRQSHPDENRHFKNWSLRLLPADAAGLDRLADIELQLGHYRAADHLGWLAAGVRELKA